MVVHSRSETIYGQHIAEDLMVVHAYFRAGVTAREHLTHIRFT